MKLLLKWLLFLFCAVPGLLIMLAFSIDLFAAYFSPEFGKSPIIDLIVILLSMLMMLVGVGKWKQWRYLFVFASIPTTLFIVIFLQGVYIQYIMPIDPFAGKRNYLPIMTKILPAIIVGLSALYVANYIARHRRKSGSRGVRPYNKE